MTAIEGGPARARPGEDPAPGARWAAMPAFLITGLVFATYFVRMPSFKLEYGLSDGQLGVLLMLPVLAGLVTMQLTGSLVARFGSAPIARITMVALPL